MKKFWRVDSGFTLNKTDTAWDVLCFEQDELGNDTKKQALKVLTRSQLKRINWRGIVWLCKTKRAARRYGKPEEFYVDNATILADDGDKGFLVLL